MRSMTLLAAGVSLALAAPCLAQTSQSNSTRPQPGQPPVQLQTPGTGQQPASQGASQSTRPQVTQSQASDQQGTLQTGTGQAPPQSASANSSGTGMAIAQQMKHDLEQSGFTDVTIMPESFLIRAHDKQGRPVMMVVNPDSVLAMTKMGGPSKMGDSANAGGSASNPTKTTQ